MKEREGGGEEDGDSESSGQSSDAPVGVVIFRDDYSPPSGMYYFRARRPRANGTGAASSRTSVSGVDDDLARGFPAMATTLVRDPPRLAPTSALATTPASTATQPDGLPASFDRDERGASWRTTACTLRASKRRFAFAPRKTPTPRAFESAYHVTSLALEADPLRA